MRELLPPFPNKISKQKGKILCLLTEFRCVDSEEEVSEEEEEVMYLE